VKPSAAIAAKAPIDRHRHRGRGHQHRPPVLQEDQDHDEDEQTRLDQRLVDLIDRFGDEFGGVERRVVGHSCGNAFASTCIFFSTARWTSSALAPGDWNTPMPVAACC